MTVRQADLAREIEVSEMTLHRAMKLLGRNGQPLTDLDAIMVITAAELQQLEKLNGPTSLRLIAEMASEIRYATSSRINRCWIVFAENSHGSFRMVAHTSRHLESLLSAFPLSLVLPLHEVVGRAAERLEGLQAKKMREAA